MARRDKTEYLNMVHSQLQSHFRTQKAIARAKKQTQPALNAFRIFLSVNVWGWVYHYIKSRVGKKHPFVDYSGSTSNGVFEMVSARAGDNSSIKMVVAADWATNTPESAGVGHWMKRENSDYSIHLGDIYFVGAPPEVSANFIGPDSSWPKGSSGSLAVPGNHEYYSNGNPYFDTLLPTLGARRPASAISPTSDRPAQGSAKAPSADGEYHQDASFFSLENPYWRVIALDNGYYSVGPLFIEYIFRPDAHLDKKLIAWLENTIKPGTDDNRGIVILSHIQYCSAFEPQYPKAAEILKIVFGERKVIWLWGHEHRFAIYGKYQSENGIAAYGRCIGHGGMPVELGKVRSGKETYTLPDPKKMQSNPLVCYDRRKKEIIGNTILGYNGYAVLSFDHNRLLIEYKDAGVRIFHEEWTVDEKGGLHGTAHKNEQIGLTFVADVNDAVAP